MLQENYITKRHIQFYPITQEELERLAAELDKHITEISAAELDTYITTKKETSNGQDVQHL